MREHVLCGKKWTAALIDVQYLEAIRNWARDPLPSCTNLNLPIFRT